MLLNILWVTGACFTLTFNCPIQISKFFHKTSTVRCPLPAHLIKSVDIEKNSQSTKTSYGSSRGLTNKYQSIMFHKSAFVQYLGDGPMIMEKVVHIPKYVKPWYIYQLILSQLSWNEHSSGSDKINWYMYQDFTYFGMYHFPQSFWQKTIFLPTYNSWVCHN